jgi:hypothetical protein
MGYFVINSEEEKRREEEEKRRQSENDQRKRFAGIVASLTEEATDGTYRTETCLDVNENRVSVRFIEVKSDQKIISNAFLIEKKRLISVQDNNREEALKIEKEIREFIDGIVGKKGKIGF